MILYFFLLVGIHLNIRSYTPLPFLESFFHCAKKSLNRICGSICTDREISSTYSLHGSFYKSDLFVDTAKNRPFGSTLWYTQQLTLRMWLRAQACGIEQRSSRRWSLARSSVAKMLISSHNLVDSKPSCICQNCIWTEHIFSAGTARVLSCDMSRF